MEDINAKLLEKYQTLKKRRVSEFEGLSSGENAKLKSYQQAMEKLIGSLRKENDQLHNQMLLKEDEYAKCENLLMREKEKARQLSEEVDRLNNLLSERNKCLRENEKNYCTHETEDNITSTLNLSNKVLEGISRHPSTALAEKVKGTSCNDYDVARNEENTIALDNWELQVVYFSRIAAKTTLPIQVMLETIISVVYFKHLWSRCLMQKFPQTDKTISRAFQLSINQVAILST